MSRIVVLLALALGTWAIPVAALHPSGQPDALTRLREALGGDAAISAVRTIRARGTTDRKPYKDHVEIKTELPGRFFRTVRYVNGPRLAMRTATDAAVFEPDVRSTGTVLDAPGGEETGVTMSGFDGLTPLPRRSRFESERRPELPGQILAGAYARFAEFVLPLLGNSSSVYPVSATSDGNSIVFRGGAQRWWQLDLDPATNLPARMSWTVQKNYWQVNFGEFKMIDGLRWPHRLIKSRNGAIEEDTTIEHYDLNTKLKFPK